MSNALQEMAKSLPQSNCPNSAQKSTISSGAGDASGSNCSRSYQVTAKASTIETTVEYIKNLQAEIAQMKCRLEKKSLQQVVEGLPDKAA